VRGSWITPVAGACALLMQQPTPAPSPHQAADPSAYRREIEAWRQQRQERLKADGGWLTVVGLAWLKPGVNRFGSDPASDVVLPAAVPAHAGLLRVDGRQVTVEVAAGVAVTLDGQPVTRRPLRSDADGADPDVLRLASVTMQIIDRGGRLAVRIKDRDSAARRQFRGLRWYPVKPEYRVEARFVAHDKPATIVVPSVVGIAEAMTSPGSALFELAGRPMRLDPVLEPGSPQLFFIFRDATAAKTTYGSGRFLYADPPVNGRVVLDFNKAYSPPCAYTAYATCPLPPPQNRLPVAIEAGELAPGH
jgi:uncharacterized protein (DUF1684 family)